MVQLPEPPSEKSEEGKLARKAGFATIADISRKRIDLAGQKIGKGDTGFRAYKLADTNFAKWRVTSDVTPTQLEQHLLDLRDSADDEASQDDLLTELLLKLGLSLTETIATKTIAGLDVREVGDNRVLACIDEHAKPTLEQLRALVDAGPGKLVVLEDAFHGDDQLKTNLAQYAKTRGIELRTA
jgi:adenine-specific DNA-methyltransferase